MEGGTARVRASQLAFPGHIPLPGSLRCAAHACVLGALANDAPGSTVYALSPVDGGRLYAVAFPGEVALPELDGEGGGVLVAVSGPGGQALLSLNATGGLRWRVGIANGDGLHLGGTAMCGCVRRRGGGEG